MEFLIPNQSCHGIHKYTYLRRHTLSLQHKSKDNESNNASPSAKHAHAHLRSCRRRLPCSQLFPGCFAGRFFRSRLLRQSFLLDSLCTNLCGLGLLNTQTPSRIGKNQRQRHGIVNSYISKHRTNYTGAAKTKHFSHLGI